MSAYNMNVIIDVPGYVNVHPVTLWAHPIIAEYRKRTFKLKRWGWLPVFKKRKTGCIRIHKAYVFNVGNQTHCYMGMSDFKKVKDLLV